MLSWGARPPSLGFTAQLQLLPASTQVLSPGSECLPFSRLWYQCGQSHPLGHTGMLVKLEVWFTASFLFFTLADQPETLWLLGTGNSQISSLPNAHTPERTRAEEDEPKK